MSKIAILGYGVEGKSAYNYFKSLDPTNQIDIYDQAEINDSDESVIAIKNFTDIDFSSYDTIVRSPSIPPTSLPIETTSNTQIFFDKCPAPIIGITGTKGKGSTASFINEILKSAGKKTHLIGNIGVAALDALPEIAEADFVVYELSSFQLWDIKKSPHVAVLTIIEPDHLNVHKDMDEYVGAKSNIVKYQTESDFVVYNTLDRVVTHIADNSKAVKLPYPDENLEKLVRPNIKLVGDHQIQNGEAAILAAKAVVPDITNEQITTGISNFEGLPHRLKLVREVNGVKYYDDSIATTPGSAIAAIKSFDEPKILLLGGQDKGADYTELAKEIAKNNVKKAIIYGENRHKIIEALKQQNYGQITEVTSQNMSDIVDSARKAATTGDAVILSPAAASFDMFKSYADRGEQFVSAVNL